MQQSYLIRQGKVMSSTTSAVARSAQAYGVGTIL
nr:MAG TPA: hypothetical protein [Caudoviricetes sp.]DAY37497.1 MAG TPA: hypothetical protein [Caudoviricetes sp.]